jgi:ribonuclease Z
MLDIALLGCGGMMPLPNRFLTSMFLRLNGRFLLLDCGEGTQVSLKMLGWGFKNIDVILITHFHADHVAGLPGLLLTITNSGRTEPLHMIGPKGLEIVVKCLLVIAPELPFEIIFHEMEDATNIKIGEFHISSLPVEHRMPCFAYSIDVKRRGKFNINKAKALNLPRTYWSILQKNEMVLYEGKEYLPEMVMGDERKGLKVSYCTDSRPVAALPDFIKDSDLFICEGIYGEDEKLNKAMEYKHMLFSEAATLAKKGNVSELWLTHYSPSLTAPEEFLSVAKDIFENTHLGFDRKTAALLFSE